MIYRIEAVSRHKINGKKCHCYGKKFTWDRRTINYIIGGSKASGSPCRLARSSVLATTP